MITKYTAVRKAMYLLLENYANQIKDKQKHLVELTDEFEQANEYTEYLLKDIDRRKKNQNQLLAEIIKIRTKLTELQDDMILVNHLLDEHKG